MKVKAKRLYMLVGIPGVGKSTWIRDHEKYFHPSHKIISRDQVRFSLVAEDEPYFSKEKEVFKEFIRQIKDSLENNYETYIDATHINEASRSKVLRALGETLKDVNVYAIVIKDNIDNIIERNSFRTGRTFVPESAVKRMYSSFTIPTLEEGFDQIWVYSPTDKTRVEIFKSEIEY